MQLTLTMPATDTDYRPGDMLVHPAIEGLRLEYRHSYTDPLGHKIASGIVREPGESGWEKGVHVGFRAERLRRG